MANVCLYKIRVSGTKDACYALINMMPLYDSEKEIIDEREEDDVYTVVFSGDCKWAVDAYTEKHNDIKPFTEEEIKNVRDGEYWDYPLEEKSVLLSCEIWCNSKDIDDCGWAYYEHYNEGKAIIDECPKELHIKRGRDYDFSYIPVAVPASVSGKTATSFEYKIKFEKGTYLYESQTQYELNDIVTVFGAMAEKNGKIIEVIPCSMCGGLCQVEGKVGHIEPFIKEDVEALWKSSTTCEKQLELQQLGYTGKNDKKKFLSLSENKWTEKALEGNTWDEFMSWLNAGHIEIFE